MGHIIHHLLIAYSHPHIKHFAFSYFYGTLSTNPTYTHSDSWQNKLFTKIVDVVVVVGYMFLRLGFLGNFQLPNQWLNESLFDANKKIVNFCFVVWAILQVSMLAAALRWVDLATLHTSWESMCNVSGALSQMYGGKVSYVSLCCICGNSAKEKPASRKRVKIAKWKQTGHLLLPQIQNGVCVSVSKYIWLSFAHKTQQVSFALPPLRIGIVVLLCHGTERSSKSVHSPPT